MGRASRLPALLSLLPLLLLPLVSPAHAAPRPLVSYAPTDDRLFLWLGRTLANSSDNSVMFDVEGASVSFTVANASFVGVEIRDQTAGGARLGVYVNTSAAQLAGIVITMLQRLCLYRWKPLGNPHCAGVAFGCFTRARAAAEALSVLRMSSLLYVCLF